MKWIRGIWNKPDRNLAPKVRAGIDFTLRNYQETLRDLARYDRGESVQS